MHFYTSISYNRGTKLVFSFKFNWLFKTLLGLLPTYY